MMGVKRTNRSAALRILHERGSMSRKRLSETIKLTPAAITKIVGEMIAEGLLTEGSMLPGSGAGRREVMVELNSRARAALGIFINLREAIVSAAWLDGAVIFSESFTLPPKAPWKRKRSSAWALRCAASPRRTGGSCETASAR